MFRNDDLDKLDKEQREERVKAFYAEWERIRKALVDPDQIKPQQREADSTDKNRLDKGKINNDLAIFKRPTTPPKPIIRIKPTPITVGTQTWATTRVKNAKPYPPSYIAPKNIPTPKPKSVTVRPKPTPGKYAALHSKVKCVTLARPNPETKSVGLVSKGCASVRCVPLSSKANTIGNKSIPTPLKYHPGLKSFVVSTKPNVVIKAVGAPSRPQIIFKSAFPFNSANTKCAGIIPPPVSNIKKPLKDEIVTVSSKTSKTGRYDHATIFRTESPTLAEKPATENHDA